MDKYKKIRSYIENRCKELKVDDFEIIIDESESISASSFKREINKEASSYSTSLSLRLIVNRKEGVCSTQSLDIECLDDLILRAYDNALTSDKAEAAIIYEGSNEYPKLEECDDVSYDVLDIRAAALDSLESLYKKDKRVVDGSSTSAAYVSYSNYFASSKGYELSSKHSGAYLVASAKVEEKESVENAYSIKEGEIDKLDVTSAVDKAIRKINSKKIKSGKYNVIFSNECMIEILSTFFSVFSGKSDYLNITRLKEMNGKKVASDCVTIIDDPFYPGYRFNQAYDGDGCPTERKSIIENGILNTLLYNLEYANKCSCKSTGNGFRSASTGESGVTHYSFYIKESDKCFDELLKAAESGVYITSMKGFHAGADVISGDFSIDSEGEYFEDGELKYPIKSFTVSGNFYDLLLNIYSVASDLLFDVTLSSDRIGSPSIFVKDLSIAGE